MKLPAVLLVLASLGAPTGVVAADFKGIEQKITQLNDQSVKLLGVSLNALLYLVGANPSTYLHLQHLESSGEMDFILELEAKGYVKTEVVQALPDGTQKNVKFLRVMPIGDGATLKRSIIAMPRNIILRPAR